MPYDPSQLPDLGNVPLSPEERLRERLNRLAGMLGEDFSFKGGIKYDNGKLAALLKNNAVEASIPFMGGTIKASVKDFNDPYYRIQYRKMFK